MQTAHYFGYISAESHKDCLRLFGYQLRKYTPYNVTYATIYGVLQGKPILSQARTSDQFAQAKAIALSHTITPGATAKNAHKERQLHRDS